MSNRLSCFIMILITTFYLPALATEPKTTSDRRIQAEQLTLDILRQIRTDYESFEEAFNPTQPLRDKYVSEYKELLSQAVVDPNMQNEMVESCEAKSNSIKSKRRSRQSNNTQLRDSSRLLQTHLVEFRAHYPAKYPEFYTRVQRGCVALGLIQKLSKFDKLRVSELNRRINRLEAKLEQPVTRPKYADQGAPVLETQAEDSL